MKNKSQTQERTFPAKGLAISLMGVFLAAASHVFEEPENSVRIGNHWHIHDCSSSQATAALFQYHAQTGAERFERSSSCGQDIPPPDQRRYFAKWER